jgi:osomolarity two-component system, response regulator SKN7
MLNFQRTLSTQDNVMQNLIQYIVNPENNSARDNMPILSGDQAQKLISSYDEAAKASVDIMNDLSQLGASLGPTVLANAPQQVQGHVPPRLHLQEAQQYGATTLSPSYSVKSDHVKTEYTTPTREGFASTATSPDSKSGRPAPPKQQQPQQPQQRGQVPAPTLDDTPANDTYAGFNNFSFGANEPAGDARHTGGLRVFTVGHFAPRQEDDVPLSTDNPVQQAYSSPPPNMPILKDLDERPNPNSHSLRVRRQTFVPGWAVPPKILLVDDDAVYRNMSTKFLQVFGCEADVAYDGFSAMEKVGVEKYDLILMDVVMPNLDGIATTNMIRQFDIATPIISMTSNIHSNDIMQYFNSGTPPPPGTVVSVSGCSCFGVLWGCGSGVDG